MKNKRLVCAACALILTLTGCSANRESEVPNSTPNNEYSDSSTDSAAESSAASSAAESDVTEPDKGSDYTTYALSAEEYKTLSADICRADCSDGAVIALTSSGDVVTFGNNYCGKIGNGEIESHAVGAEVTPTSPYMIDFSDRITDVLNSLNTSFAITEDGTVYAWGRNEFGETGLSAGNITRPARLDINKKIRKIASGNATNLFLTDDGEVYLSGIDILNYKSLSELNENVAYEVIGADNAEPQAITVADVGYRKLDLPFVAADISTGLLHYSFLSDEGEVYVQGTILGSYNNSGSDIAHESLYKIPFPEKITAVESGSNIIVALSAEGNVYIYANKESAFFDENEDVEISQNIFKKHTDNPIVSICCDLYCVSLVDNAGNALGFGIDNWGAIDSSNADDDPSTYEIICKPRKIIDEEAICCKNDIMNSVIVTKDKQLIVHGADVMAAGESSAPEPTTDAALPAEESSETLPDYYTLETAESTLESSATKEAVDIPEAGNAYYDKELKGTTNSAGAPMSYEDVMSMLKVGENEHEEYIDSFFLVETVKALSLKE